MRIKEKKGCYYFGQNSIYPPNKEKGTPTFYIFQDKDSRMSL